MPQRPTAVAPVRLMRETSCLLMLTLLTSTISTTLHDESAGDVEAVAELRLDADVLQLGVDLWTAAMHEHGAQADA